MKLKQKLHTGVRVLLKYTLNPLTRRLAKTSHGPFSLIRHVGRRSGKPYETPIIVGQAEDGFVAELTYGPNVDWYQNVLAAGGGTLLWHGQDHVIDKIVPMTADSGRSAFPLPAQVILRLIKRQHYVKLMTARVGAGTHNV